MKRNFVMKLEKTEVDIEDGLTQETIEMKGTMKLNFVDSGDVGLTWDERTNENMNPIEIPQDHITPPAESSSWDGCKNLIRSIFLSNLFPDDVRFLGNYRMFESTEVVKVLKFVGWSIWMIIMMMGFINFTDWERDQFYTIREFFFYELTPVIQDCIVFAVVGRLYRKQGFDRLFPTLLPCMISCVCGSWSSEIWWMRNSITLYNLACTWPWQLWLFGAGSVTIVMFVLALHMRESFRDLTYLYRLVEMAIVLVICILPYLILQDPSFHLHHYYSFWMMGLVFNRDEWWSELAQAIAFGQYINGVAVYGRDRLIPHFEVLSTRNIREDYDSNLSFMTATNGNWKNCDA